MAIDSLTNEPFTDIHTPRRLQDLLNAALIDHDTWYHNGILIDDLAFIISSGFLGRVNVRFYRISEQNIPLATVECPLNISSTSLMSVLSKANLRVAL